MHNLLSAYRTGRLDRFSGERLAPRRINKRHVHEVVDSNEIVREKFEGLRGKYEYLHNIFEFQPISFEELLDLLGDQTNPEGVEFWSNYNYTDKTYYLVYLNQHNSILDSQFFKFAQILWKDFWKSLGKLNKDGIFFRWLRMNIKRPDKGKYMVLEFAREPYEA